MILEIVGCKLLIKEGIVKILIKCNEKKNIAKMI